MTRRVVLLWQRTLSPLAHLQRRRLVGQRRQLPVVTHTVAAVDNNTIGATDEVGMAGVGVGMVELAESIVVHVIVLVVSVRVVTAGVSVITKKRSGGRA